MPKYKWCLRVLLVLGLEKQQAAIYTSAGSAQRAVPGEVEVLQNGMLQLAREPSVPDRSKQEKGGNIAALKAKLGFDQGFRPQPAKSTEPAKDKKEKNKKDKKGTKEKRSDGAKEQNREELMTAGGWCMYV